MQLSTTMTRITLYTKAGCHLCEKARDALLRVARDYPLAIDIVDITLDNELYERYWDVIPVVEVAGTIYTYTDIIAPDWAERALVADR